MPRSAWALVATLSALSVLVCTTPARAAECHAPTPPQPYTEYNPHVYRNFIQTGETGDYLRLVNVLGVTPPLGPDTGGTYSQILVGYDPMTSTVQVLTAYHNLSRYVNDGGTVTIEQVREHYLQNPDRMHRAYLSRELIPEPGSIFCKQTALQDGIRTLRMLDIETPAANEHSSWTTHPVDIALVTYQLQTDVLLNITELYNIDTHFAINARLGSADLPALVDGRADIALTGWGLPYTGELQMLMPDPREPESRYLGEPDAIAHPHRSALRIHEQGPPLTLSGFSGGGVFLRGPHGKRWLLGIDSGQRPGEAREILFTNLYRGADDNLVGWLREHMGSGGAWHMVIDQVGAVGP